jgi:hypothetical protein
MMIAKSPLSRTLLACAVGILLAGAVVGAAAGQPEEDVKVSATTGDPAPLARVVVYYFHGKQRCKKCRTIESYAEETVRTSFAEELGTGALVWKTVNFDEPENEHYLYDFELPGSSLVVVEMEAGQRRRFKILQEVWTLVGDKEAFTDYVREGVGKFLD